MASSKSSTDSTARFAENVVIDYNIGLRNIASNFSPVRTGIDTFPSKNLGKTATERTGGEKKLFSRLNLRMSCCGNILFHDDCSDQEKKKKQLEEVK